CQGMRKWQSQPQVEDVDSWSKAFFGLDGTHSSTCAFTMAQSVSRRVFNVQAP
ncbi:hypothetical protein C368_02322, partial [Cryptococcus neoformans 125.91]